MGKFKVLMEQYDNLLEYLIEGTGFTFSDYVKEVPSPRNIKFYELRKKEGKTGSYLKGVEWDDEKDGLILKYDVVPTYKKDIKVVDKNGIVSGGNKYVVEIMFEDIEKNLGKLVEFVKLKKIEQIEMFRIMLRKGTIRVSSNDCSWHFQGGAENGSLLGYSIYPFKGVKGKGIWSRKHRGESPAVYITKHIIEVMKTIPFLVAMIVSEINKKYK